MHLQYFFCIIDSLVISMHSGKWEIVFTYGYSWTSPSCRPALAYGDTGHLFYCDVHRCRLGMQCILIFSCAMRYVATSYVYYIRSRVIQYILLHFLSGTFLWLME